ncbi:MAG: CPBP family intramembrane metalloprotease [Amaricoccus sp.]|uniref:CPBP family intramembrane glutamic endopeptidase n=1 Tax=Amaricoccus sp. TaxID=1872485 RepID=UPI0039E313DD
MAIASPQAPTRRARLGVEFALIYLAAPVVLATALPPSWLHPLFLGVTAAAIGLLRVTPDFRWRELGHGWRSLDWREIGLVAALTAVASLGFVLWLVPESLLRLPRRVPGFWLLLMVLYPILSALPQEIVFRALFFRRYGALFPDRRVAVLVNGGVFALAHLLFWSPVTLSMTFVGGLLFARGYLGRGGFAQAWVMHAICGLIIFTMGLGMFFYHGAVR